jgi:hypothetical protein
MPENDPDPTPPPAPNPPAPKVEFTPEQHDEINRIVARNNAETERRVRQAVTGEFESYLGAEKDKADRADMAEIDRLKVERDEATKKATEAAALAEQTRRTATATTALIASGIKPDAITHALRMLDLDVDDLSDENVAAQIKALQDTLPSLFAGGDTPPAPHLQPVGPRKPAPGPATAEERGRSYLQAAGIPIPDIPA